MNILFYCDEYPPVLNGGIGSVTKVVAEELVHRGHTIVVAGNYSRFNSDFPNYSCISGVHIYRFKKEEYKGITLKTYTLFHRITKKFSHQIARQRYYETESFIEKLVKKYKIEIVEMPDYQDEFYTVLKKTITLKKNFSAPLIIRLHGTWSALLCHLKLEIPEHVMENEKCHMARADYICGVSKDSTVYVKQFMLPDRKYDFIYNPVEEKIFTKELLNYPEPEKILFFGKIDKRKGAFELAKAFDLVAEKIPAARLFYVGYGDTERVLSQIDKKYHDRVIFKGFMTREELLQEIDSAFVCVLPSYFETFAMAAVEVAARNRALIFSEINTGKELIDDGETGWLIHPDNIQQIAERLIESFKNPEKTAKMAHAGYERCKKLFSTETIIPQLEQYYQSIINNTKK